MSCLIHQKSPWFFLYPLEIKKLTFVVFLTMLRDELLQWGPSLLWQLIPLCFLPPFGISLHLATWVLSLPSVSCWALVFFEGGRRLLRDFPLGLPMLYLKCREGICCLCSSQSHFGFPHQLMVTWRSWTWAGTCLHSWESWLTDFPFSICDWM